MALPVWAIALIISTALQVLSYVITPRPKAPKPEAAQQAENPTAEAGRPLPKMWGSMRVSATNIIGYWDKTTGTYQVSA